MWQTGKYSLLLEKSLRAPALDRFHAAPPCCRIRNIRFRWKRVRSALGAWLFDIVNRFPTPRGRTDASSRAAVGSLCGERGHNDAATSMTDKSPGSREFAVNFAAGVKSERCENDDGIRALCTLACNRAQRSSLIFAAEIAVSSEFERACPCSSSINPLLFLRPHFKNPCAARL